MTAAVEHLSTYLEDFERLAENLDREPAWLRERRKQALSRFSELGFPTTRQEEYKYTNLAPIARADFRLAALSENAVAPGQLRTVLFEELAGSRLVFVDGHFRPGLSRLAAQPGVVVGSLARSVAADPAAFEGHLTRYADPQDHALLALNTAFFQDGACVQIADGAIVDGPLQIVFVSTASQPNAVTHPRVLILAGRDAEVSVIESYVGLGSGAYWSNAVTEIVAEENARIDHTRIQLEQPSAFHTSVTQVLQERNATYSSHVLSFGALLARNDINVVLDDEGGHCDLNGLFVVNGRQHVDHHTVIDHAKPHCTSNQLYKGVLDGQSRGVFNGKIIVRPNAQKTNAFQSNKNLLLSEDADINTKPQLQIDANDVRCTHGATVGQIDKDALFYLRSRGIPEAVAHSLLIYAFGADILERIKLEPVRDHFEAMLMGRLTHNPQAEVPR
jgi:Fe-S cluster assembly protein SufD